jgi:hypothetical protein
LAVAVETVGRAVTAAAAVVEITPLSGEAPCHEFAERLFQCGVGRYNVVARLSEEGRVWASETRAVDVLPSARTNVTLVIIVGDTLSIPDHELNRVRVLTLAYPESVEVAAEARILMQLTTVLDEIRAAECGRTSSGCDYTPARFNVAWTADHGTLPEFAEGLAREDIVTKWTAPDYAASATLRYFAQSGAAALGASGSLAIAVLPELSSLGVDVLVQHRPTLNVTPETGGLRVSVADDDFASGDAVAVTVRLACGGGGPVDEQVWTRTFTAREAVTAALLPRAGALACIYAGVATDNDGLSTQDGGSLAPPFAGE